MLRRPLLALFATSLLGCQVYQPPQALVPAVSGQGQPAAVATSVTELHVRVLDGQSPLVGYTITLQEAVTGRAVPLVGSQSAVTDQTGSFRLQLSDVRKRQVLRVTASNQARRLESFLVLRPRQQDAYRLQQSNEEAISIVLTLQTTARTRLLNGLARAASTLSDEAREAFLEESLEKFEAIAETLDATIERDPNAFLGLTNVPKTHSGTVSTAHALRHLVNKARADKSLSSFLVERVKHLSELRKVPENHASGKTTPLGRVPLEGTDLVLEEHADGTMTLTNVRSGKTVTEGDENMEEVLNPPAAEGSESDPEPMTVRTTIR